MLEDEVDEKYYLSDKMINYISANNEKWTGNNKEALINKDIATTINTGEGSRRCDASNYICNELEENFNLKIKVKNTTKEDTNFVSNKYKEFIDENGLSPTIHTCQGGNTEPKVMINEKDN